MPVAVTGGASAQHPPLTRLTIVAVCRCHTMLLRSLAAETKNQWARDDPAFVAVLMAFLLVSTIAYGIAFRVSGFGTWLWMLLHAQLHFLGAGAAIATVGWWFANKYLRVHHSHSVEQEVEWLYAFDIHCNAFFPFFVLLCPVQYLLLPFVMGDSFLGTALGNTLYAAAFVAYVYIHFLGYMALPFLQRTQVFLYPVVAVAVVYVTCLVLQISIPAWAMWLYFDYV